MGVQWVTAFLDRRAAGRDAAAAFWARVTAGTLSPVRGVRGEFATVLPPDGEAYLRVQTVLEGPGGTHLDLHVPDVESAARRAQTLGATAVPRDGYVALTSPAGLPWCLVPAAGAPRRPAPVEREGGHHSLLDQVCIDIPPDAFAAECAFWQEVTGWQLRPGSRPEFAYLVRPPGIAVRLLLQRLDDMPADGRARAHPDLACGDVPAEVALHQTWGARVLGRFPHWTALSDPSGMPYCVTRRDPVTGTLPA
ncbi:MAG TPA: VOC family protein [Kineosporiaceae bacterium]|nr:VOC family protein [Kineosporiaceae bacterium]